MYPLILQSEQFIMLKSFMCHPIIGSSNGVRGSGVHVSPRGGRGWRFDQVYLFVEDQVFATPLVTIGL